ncbi:hypothetical protein [Rhodospirillum rubrum]|uniref:hypothetical protein n=1 Tax=Rhodospirillum rubrum TaxID=1085 RepID=UPI001A92558C|nr:hypothetical protein [Rhodospirillum rubrum]
MANGPSGIGGRNQGGGRVAGGGATPTVRPTPGRPASPGRVPPATDPRPVVDVRPRPSRGNRFDEAGGRYIVVDGRRYNLDAPRGTYVNVVI